jgi:hypothetical protein
MLHRQAPAFIFVHIPKTGGTSIECALCQYFLDSPLHTLERDQADAHLLPTRNVVHQHFKLQHFQSRFGLDLEQYFTFSFVRNPWDLVVAEIAYFQRQRHPVFRGCDFRQAVRRMIEFVGTVWGHDFAPQTSYLTNQHGVIAMDFIGRFETLQDDFNLVCDRLDMPRLLLPQANCSPKPRAHYSAYYDQETRALVERHFATDIETFGYCFKRQKEARVHC